jgi:hypothetical protein
MPRTLDEVIAKLPEGDRAKIEARAQELIAEEMSLRKLRKAIGKTQTAVAKRLKVGQDAVSKIETRSDMYVSTLRDFIKAMGGELELVAQFPDRAAETVKHGAWREISINQIGGGSGVSDAELNHGPSAQIPNDMFHCGQS